MDNRRGAVLIETEPEPGLGERAQMGRQHVFIVNGSPEFLNLMRELLQEEQYNVTTTNYVPETFDQVAALRPSLLVVDLESGVRAGWDLLAALRDGALTRGIPVIVVSTDPRLLEQAEREQVAGDTRRYLVKPFDLDEILATIRTLIGPA